MPLWNICEQDRNRIHLSLYLFLSTAALVDGKLSQWAYLSSVDTCYQRYKAKYAAKHLDEAAITVDHFDYFAFHSPYNKLVQKGFGRFLFVDSREVGEAGNDKYSTVKQFQSMSVQDTYESRDLEAAYRALSNSRLHPSYWFWCCLRSMMCITYSFPLPLSDSSDPISCIPFFCFILFRYIQVYGTSDAGMSDKSEHRELLHGVGVLFFVVGNSCEGKFHCPCEFLVFFSLMRLIWSHWLARTYFISSAVRA